MTSGNNFIPAMSSGDTSQAGTSQFGINLRSNSLPPVGSNPTGGGNGEPTAAYNTPNQFQFLDSDIIAESSGADYLREYTVSYIVNVSGSQAPGIYVSTLTYVCTGSF
jgi:hypothetical protein